MSGIREGRWLCKNCGSECRGRDEECNGLDGQSGCGAARASGTRFYLPENSPYVTDSLLLDDAASGQDWNCSHCDGANKGSIAGRRVSQCAHCGNARDAEDKTVPVRFFALGDTLSSSAQASRTERDETLSLTRARRESRVEQQIARHGGSHVKNGATNLKGAAIAALAAAFVVLAGWWAWSFFTARHEVTHEVAYHHWERSISHEIYKTLSDEGWDPPSDARIDSSYTKIRSYRDVLDRYEQRQRQKSREVASGTQSYNCGTVDMGNGYFQDKTCSRTLYRTEYYTETYQEPIYRKEPVYGTWHAWKVDRWVFDRAWRSKDRGIDRHWAETPALHDKLRETGRSEALYLQLVSSEHGDKNWQVNEKVWLLVKDGETLISVTDWKGSVLESRTASGTQLPIE